ncbi:MAG: hypothetical protein JXA57_17090 [Armatimonadetes bacterium]|nr:hypothetical protein [Armatimonadota bacterium]
MSFISEPIEVRFGAHRGFEKRPACPEAFVWRDETHRITELLSEWQDHSRRGKMAHNMRPSHLETASKKGSWGVGRHYFRVRTGSGRVFEIYYDRAPKDATRRKGGWYLFRELPLEEDE